jgi:tetratricopeptide (TPR) repeat protein
LALNRDRTLKLALNYRKNRQPERAVAELERFVAENRGDWHVIRMIGDLYVEMGRNPEAVQRYSQVADSYRRDGFNVRAIATYKMMLRLDPQNEPAMRSLAELQQEQGLIMEAKAQLHHLRELYERTGQKRKVHEVFKRLAEIDPNDPRNRYDYAKFLEREGRVDEAVAEYARIAEDFINKGRVAEAAQILDRGLQIDGGSRTLRTKMAQAASLLGDNDKAIRVLEEIRPQHPRDVELLTRLGEAYTGAGRAEEASGVFRRLAEIEPDNLQHAARLAELAVSEGRYDQALELVAPSVDLLVSRRDGERAVGLLQKILAREPRHVKTLVKLVDLHTQLRQDSGRLSACDQLCEAYLQKGQLQLAAGVARQLIELEPENSQHRDRLRFIEDRLGGRPPAPEASPSPRLAEFEPAESFTRLDRPFDLGMDEEDEFGRVTSGEPRTEEEVGPIPVLSPEDEEHVREKFTEAEVFVRYGLVEKAIEQLRDLLETFPFHTGSLEKLIEVYVDQGMNREAAEHLLKLAQVEERMGNPDRAAELRRQAMEQEPALAGSSRAGASIAQPAEDVDLLLPASESRYQEELDLLPRSEEAFEDEARLTPDASDLLPEALGALDDEKPIPSLAGLAAEEARRMELSSAVPVSSAGVGDDLADIPIEVDFGDEVLRTPAAPALETTPEALSLTLDEGEPVPEPVFRSFAAEETPGVGLLDEVEEQEDEEPILSEPMDDAPFVVEDDAALSDLAKSSGPVPWSTDADSESSAVVQWEDDRVAPPAAEESDEPVFGEAFVLDHLPEDVPFEEASPEPAETGVTGPDEIHGLAEVDEYVSLGLYEDARHTLRELLSQYADHPRLLQRIEELGFEDLLGAHAPEPAVPPEERPAPLAALDRERGEEHALEADLPPEPFVFATQAEEPIETEAAPFDAVMHLQTGRQSASTGAEFDHLSADLTEEMVGVQSAVAGPLAEAPSGALTDPGLEEIFREFKKGVEKQLSSEDYDTRYNLGIAYKEMGLLDEAIAEFQLASKDEQRLLECCSMLGLCFMEKGLPEIAIKWFEKGLKATGRTGEEYQGLRYDLATAHEAAGEADAALALFMEIYRVNTKFRDVGERVRELQAARK